MSIHRWWSTPVVAAPLAVVAVFLAAGCAGSPGTVSPVTPNPAKTAQTLTLPAETPSTTLPPTTEPTKPPVAADDWSQVLADVRDSVVRLSITRCVGDPVMGSGFIVGDDLVITAAHVVRGARTVSVQTDGQDIVDAVPVAVDLDADTALLRTDSPLGADTMTVSAQEPPQGSALAALGFPLGANDLRISQGIVSGLGSSIDYGDQQVDNVFTTDAATNGGNSGGPVINHSGVVIGLVSGGVNWDFSDEHSPRPVQGINYIVPSTEVSSRLERWRDQLTSPADACEQDVEPPVGDSHVLKVSVVSNHKDAADIAQILFSHGESINLGSYSSAWSLFTPAMQRAMGRRSTWQSGLSTSYWGQLEVREVKRTADTAIANTVLVTRQDAKDGPRGQTCSVWLINYRMKLVKGHWLIDQAKAPAPPSAC